MSPAPDRNDTATQLINLIAHQLRRTPDTVQESLTMHDLGADSLDLVEIVIQTEEHFGVQIDDAQAEKLTTVKELIDYVHALRTASR